MTSIAVIIGRCVAGCLGVILIYSALFLYKEEEGGLENRIEQWWQRIRDLHAHAISRETAFLKVVADVTSKGFAKLFGERLFGLKAVAASICYSQAAIFLLGTIVGLPLSNFTARQMEGFVVGVNLSRFSVRQMEGFRLTAGTLCLFFLFMGSLGPFIHRQSQKLFWLSSALIATVGWPPLSVAVFNRFFGTQFLWTRTSIAFGEMLIFAVLCDFFFIVLTRAMLTRAAQSNSFIKIATLALGNACLAAVLCIAPIVGAVFWYPQARFNPFSSLVYRKFVNQADRLLVLVGSSNFLDALVSLTWFLIAIMMLLHRFFWPLIERPVYALYRHRVFSEQKKLVFFSGVALLGLAIPSVGHALENVVKAVHG